MARTVGIVAVVLVLYPLSLTGTEAHHLGYDSVNGGQLAIRDLTQYDTERQWVIAQWNALTPIWVYAWYSGQGLDLTMDDYFICEDDRNAYYSHGTSKIRFNICQMEQNTPAQRKKTATHEVSHARGLDHSFFGQVMYAYTDSTNTIQSHDECDYKILWDGWSYCTCHDPCFAGGGS